MLEKNRLQKFPKQKKERSLKSIIHSLDKVFSVYIRRRDANKDGICKCVTCPSQNHWKSMDAGHFVQRDRYATRWDERNAAAQCGYCNRFRSGEQYLFGLAIDRRWGHGTAEQLKTIGSARGTKLDRFAMLCLLEQYKAKLANLK